MVNKIRTIHQNKFKKHGSETQFNANETGVCSSTGEDSVFTSLTVIISAISAPLSMFLF